MKLLPLIFSGASFALMLSASGQTFTLDDTAPYAPLTYRNTQDYVVKDGTGATAEITFTNTTGSGTNPYSVNPVSLKTTQLTLANSSSIEVFDICAEIFVGPTGSSTYSVSQGFGTLNASQISSAQILFSNALPDFIFARDNLSYDDASVIGAAIQLAFWEIAEENVLTSPLSSLDDAALGGAFSVTNFGTGYDGTAAAALAQAEGYLQNINSGFWVDQGGLTFYYADSATEQDRLWVGLEAIPEPSTALLGILGGLFCISRRRR